MTVEGFWASSTNPVHWSPYEIAKKSSHGDGLGFVLNGDGIVCIDLDHCIDSGVLNSEAQVIVDLFPNAYVEVSPSGNGLHIWGLAELESGRRFQWNGQAVEIYPDGRYMTMTGKVFRNGGLPELDLTQLLSETQVV